MPREIPDQRFFRLVGIVLAFLTELPSPVANHQVDELMQILGVVLLLLASFPIVPHLPNRIMQRLDPDFHGFDYRGRNVFVEYANQKHLFWLNTGELPETMMHIATEISAELSRLNRRGRLRQRRRNSKISNVNKVLLTFMWLRKYPCLDTLALMFDISPSTVCSIIYRVVPILWRYFRNQVSWPNLAEWNSMRGNWRSFPNAVGCIDGTPYEIYRPQVEPQRDFFSGHRHYHIINTQLIVDNVGNIVFLQAGFLGSLNDAGNFNLMERIGPGTNNDMPLDVVLLADKGYGDIPPLLTPFRAAQIRRLLRHVQRMARRFNRRLSRCRIIIEHTTVFSRDFGVASPKLKVAGTWQSSAQRARASRGVRGHGPPENF